MRPGSKEARPRGSAFGGASAALAAFLLVVSAVSIARLRPALQAHFQTVEVRSDSLLLPPPEQTVVASLGYRSALADLIWSHVLVSYGIHFQEKRRFEFIGNYLDTVNALDPKFRDPYRFADTLMTLQPERVPVDNYRKAREILERGLANLPYDTELWSSTGQFMAYIAAAQLPESERAEWRLDGARKLARACELIGNNTNVPYHCIGAAQLLSEAGETAARRKFLERLKLTSDDPEIQAMADIGLQGVANDQGIQRGSTKFQRAWGRDLPFVTRGALLVVGPHANPAHCAGLGHENDASCASSWRDWSADLDSAEANAAQ